MTKNLGGILVPTRGRHWHCNKRRPVFMVDDVAFCPNCGRRVRERYVMRPSSQRPEYIRTHVGLWGTYGGC